MFLLLLLVRPLDPFAALEVHPADVDIKVNIVMQLDLLLKVATTTNARYTR